MWNDFGAQCCNLMHFKIVIVSLTQAQDIARDFNKKLAMIPGVTMSTPRIEFLDCCVVEIKLPGTPPFAILVEEMIDKQR